MAADTGSDPKLIGEDMGSDPCLPGSEAILMSYFVASATLYVSWWPWWSTLALFAG